MNASVIRKELVWAYRFLFIFAPGLFPRPVQAQKFAAIEVVLPHHSRGLDIPVQADLDGLPFVPDSLLTLVALDKNKRTSIPFQIVSGERRTVHWLVKPGSRSGEIRRFELVKARALTFEPIVADRGEGTLTIRAGKRRLLQYRFQIAYPPAGVDSSYGRSGFIHPLWTPHGHALTRIHAPDHYHHYGIWNPWTNVLFEGDTLDFWNLKRKKGTVRFSGFVSVTEGPVYAEFRAQHEHVAIKRDRTHKVALHELQTVRVYRPEEDQGYYLVDFTSELNCAGGSPFHILEYRYAGLGWRATEKWNKDNSEVLTSEGRTRKGADGTSARWYGVQGALDHDYGGAVMLSHPSNYNHPEPLRIWPESSVAGGEVFAMFAPTKDRDWVLLPGKTYTLRYRFIVFRDRFEPERAEAAWQYFAEPAKVTVSALP